MMTIRTASLYGRKLNVHSHPRAIAGGSVVFVGRCVSDCAARTQTQGEWMRVVIDCDREATRDGATNRHIARAIAVAARLMAEGDAETAARELAAVRGQTVEAWRAEVCGG